MRGISRTDLNWNADDEAAARKVHSKLCEISKKIHPREAADFEENFHRALNECEAVSFDVFDTAIVRRCAAANDVFFFLKDFEPLRSSSLSMEQIFNLRKDAESQAREKLLREKGSVEVNRAEIYEMFCQKAPSLTFPALIQAEQDAEMALCERNEKIFALWKEAQKSGKKILFLSDSYFDGKFIHRLLQHCGYEVKPEEVFVSSDHRTGKYSGELFQIAGKAMGIRMNQLFHAGDDEKSDIAGAKLAGLKESLLVPKKKFSALAGSWENRKIESSVQGIAQLPQKNDFDFQFGYEVFGPLFTGFSLWLIDSFKKSKTEKVYFLLRDGWILSRVFEIFRQKYSNVPEAKLLHSSRRAFGVAALGCSGALDTEFLLVSANPRPAKEFLTRLDLDAEKLADAFREAGFASLDEVVDHRGKPDKVLALLRNPAVLQALQRRALVERKLLMRYFEEAGLFEGKKTALVDLGWNGTVQKCFVTILNAEEKNIDCEGYYLGTFAKVQECDLKGYRYSGYLCNHGDPWRVAQTIASFRELFEVVCTNFEGSLRCFTKEEGRVKPVLDALEISEEQIQRIRKMHEGILAYAQKFCSQALSPALIPPEIAAANVLRVIEHPTPLEAEKIGSLEYSDGAGSVTRKPLAKFSNPSLHPLDLAEAQYNAYWQQGLLAQESLQSWLLSELK